MTDAVSILKAASESPNTFDRIACRPFGLVAKAINEPVLTLLIEIMCAPSMSQVAKEVAEHIGANVEDTGHDIDAALEAMMHVLIGVQREAVKEQEQQGTQREIKIRGEPFVPPDQIRTREREEREKGENR